MNDILVSVVCTAYNHEAYIRDALEGFISQKTSFRYEVWVHDDASTDKTAEIIREYANKYPNIIRPIFQKENQYSKGIKIEREYIYPRMSGKYIAFCEGDDFWCCKDKLQLQVDFLQKHEEYSACVHNSRVLNCRTNTENFLNPCNVDKDLTIDSILQHGNAQFQLSSLMLRREYLELPDAFSAKGFGDYPLAIYLAICGKVYYFKEVMSVYRLFASGSWTSRQADPKNVEKAIEHFQEVNRMLISIDQYTNYFYHLTIQKVCLRNEVIILMRKGKYKEIATDCEMRKIYMGFCKTSKERIMFYIEAYFPRLARWYYSIRGNKNGAK